MTGVNQSTGATGVQKAVFGLLTGSLLQVCLFLFNDILLVTLRDGVIYSVIESPFALHRMAVQEVGGAEGGSQS